NHCEIETRDGRAMLREAARVPGSGPGPVILVNGEPVKERALVTGDVVRVGDTELRFNDADPYEAATVGGAVLQELLGPGAAPELASLLDKAAGRAPTPPSPAPPPSPSRSPSPYEILEEIGRGESAVVYRAHDLALKHNVAIN